MVPSASLRLSIKLGPEDSIRHVTPNSVLEYVPSYSPAFQSGTLAGNCRDTDGIWPRRTLSSACLRSSLARTPAVPRRLGLQIAPLQDEPADSLCRATAKPSRHFLSRFLACALLPHLGTFRQIETSCGRQEWASTEVGAASSDESQSADNDGN